MISFHYLLLSAFLPPTPSLFPKVEEVVRHVELLEAKIADGLALFDPRLHNQPLASLIERILRRCDRLEDELGAERERVGELLEEVGTLQVLG